MRKLSLILILDGERQLLPYSIRAGGTDTELRVPRPIRLRLAKGRGEMWLKSRLTLIVWERVSKPVQVERSSTRLCTADTPGRGLCVKASAFPATSLPS